MGHWYNLDLSCRRATRLSHRGASFCRSLFQSMQNPTLLPCETSEFFFIAMRNRRVFGIAGAAHLKPVSAHPEPDPQTSPMKNALPKCVDVKRYPGNHDVNAMPLGAAT